MIRLSKNKTRINLVSFLSFKVVLFMLIHIILAPGRIFGPVDPKDQVRQPIRRPEPNAPPARNIFTFEPPSQRPLVAANPNKLGSSFSFTHDEGKFL